MIWLHAHYHEIKSVAEFLSFIGTILVAIFALLGLKQLRHGASQIKVALNAIKSSEEIAKNNAKRESFRIAAEQCMIWAKDIVPLINDFTVLFMAGKYPVLSSCIVTEDWGTLNVQSQCNNLPGLLHEITSNDGLVITICNRMEAFAMFFTCGVADADKAYWPICDGFCIHVRRFLPYIIRENLEHKHFTYTLMLFGAWAARDTKERLEKEVAQKQEKVSKITLPTIRTFGTN